MPDLLTGRVTQHRSSVWLMGNHLSASCLEMLSQECGKQGFGLVVLFLGEHGAVVVTGLCSALY